MSQGRDNTVYWTRLKVVLSLICLGVLTAVVLLEKSKAGQIQHVRCLVLPGFPFPMPLRRALGFVLRPVSSFLSCRACTVHTPLQVPHCNFLQVNNNNSNTIGTIHRCEEHQTQLHSPTTRKVLYTQHIAALRKHNPRSTRPYPPPPLSPQRSYRPIFLPTHSALPTPSHPSLSKRLPSRLQPLRLAKYASHGSRHSPSRLVPSLFLACGDAGTRT